MAEVGAEYGHIPGSKTFRRNLVQNGIRYRCYAIDWDTDDFILTEKWLATKENDGTFLKEFHKKKRTVWIQKGKIHQLQEKSLLMKVTIHKLDINLNTWDEHYAIAGEYTTLNEARAEYFFSQRSGSNTRERD